MSFSANQTLILAACLALLVLCPAGGCASVAGGRDAAHPAASADTTSNDKAASTMPFSSKLSPGTKYHLLQLGPEENPVVAALIRIRDVLTPDRQAGITALGGEVQSAIGDIITARIPSQSLAALAELDFILYIELSHPLYPDPSAPEQPKN